MWNDDDFTLTSGADTRFPILLTTPKIYVLEGRVYVSCATNSTFVVTKFPIV
jgi:hypothetical protein